MSPLLALATVLARRIAIAAGTVFGATALVFALLSAAPGDVIDLLPDAERLRPQLEVQWGLDRAPPERWALHLWRAARLDLGTSYAVRPGAPVRELIAVPAARTVGLVAASTAVLGVGAVGLGWWTAGRRWAKRVPAGDAAAPRDNTDRLAVRSWTAALSLVPTFLLAHTLVLGLNEAAWYGIEHEWWPRPSWFALPDQASVLRDALAVMVLSVGSGVLTGVHGQAEDLITTLRGAPWADAARARGDAVAPLVLRALVAPMAARLAGHVSGLLGGAIVVEKVLLVRGAGALLWDAARLRDSELVASLALLFAIAVTGAHLVADLIGVALDPLRRRLA